MQTIKVEAAGYIVCDNEAIWGTGDTADAAWSAMIDEMARASISVVHAITYDDRGDPDPTQTLAANFRIEPATRQLIDAVETMGGAISWSRYGGVSCLSDELDNPSDR